MRRFLTLSLLFLTANLLPPVVFAQPVQRVERHANTVLLHTETGVMRLQVWSERTIRVSFSRGTVLPADNSLAVIAKARAVPFKVTETADKVTLETDVLQVRVERASSAVSFADRQGNTILKEIVEDRVLPSAGAGGVSDAFTLSAGEQIYGLGQHPGIGRMSYRGTTVHLMQQNGDVGIPFALSSKGYGLLWDDPAVTDIDVGVAGRENEVHWKSEAGRMVDYYFLLGPDADTVIRSYRELTGSAPMLPRWAWGFFQCKEHYASQDEIVGIVSQYRKRRTPIDGIIQDWQYWANGGWGSHEFDTKRYPDPAAMVKTLHGLNTHVLISVWARFDLGTANGEELARAGAMYPPVLTNVYPPGKGRWYDAFSPEGRRIYWRQISDKLFRLGFDGWWLDATEAELSGNWGEFRGYKTAAGQGAAVYNAYPLMTTTAVYQGQREETDANAPGRDASGDREKRALILTRSAYLGQQRNSAITWSGDTQGTWESFVKQVPGGLNFTASGIPYWNTDIGGFFGGKPSDPEYQELFTRWFQYGAFNPMFRVHGTGDGKEVWQWDAATQSIWEKYVRLRYRLLPYIYSTAWEVTSNGGTMMRPLMMDFRQDAEALNVPDQFMFGRAILVNPVMQKGAHERKVYLPAAHQKSDETWYDFWTGKSEKAGQHVMAPAPIDTMPLYVRAGSIIALGPELQYANEKPSDPIELRVYRGADGEFTLYEDEGDGYGYEKGVHATIPMRWKEKNSTLYIGARQGSFPGMLKDRTFHVVFVSAGHGVGVEETATADLTVRYNGRAVVLRAR